MRPAISAGEAKPEISRAFYLARVGYQSCVLGEHNDGEAIVTESGLALSKLAYTMLCLFAAEEAATYFGLRFLARDGHSWFVGYTFPAIAILMLTLLAVTVAVYKKEMSALFENSTSHFGTKNTLLGLVTGAGFLTLALLFAGKNPPVGLEGYAAAGTVVLPGILLAFVVFVTLPVLSELVFRGIVFRILSGFTTLPAATIVSASLFYFLWPMFNPVVRILFGLAMPILYHRSKS